MKERLTWPLYDTIRASAAWAIGTSLTYFSIPIGSGTSAIAGSGVKTLADTNLFQPSSLPAPGTYEIHAFRVLTDTACTVLDAQSIVNGSWFRFAVGPKDWLICPTILLPAGGGVFGSYATEVAGVLQVASHGVPDPRAIFRLSQAIKLEQQDNFLAYLTAGVAITISAAAVSDIRVVIDGEIIREV